MDDNRNVADAMVSQIKLNLSTKSIAMKSMEAIAMAFDISMACLNRRRIFIIRY